MTDHQSPATQTHGSRARRRTVLGGTLAVLLVALTALGACGSDDEPATEATTTLPASDTEPGDDAPASELDGLTFTSTAVTGHDLVADSTIRLAFADGRMTAEAGCNTLMGAYADEDGRLAWSDQPAGSMMACDDDLTEQDAWLTTLLTDGVDAELTDGELLLTTGEVTVLLVPADEG